ncbi:hypothetical protein [Gordonia aurantiaca]|uniref:hypothetical protein n=1 Tax=Gordonia sp. B21 TaxID=3151852 RepID=UPI003263375D
MARILFSRLLLTAAVSGLGALTAFAPPTVAPAAAAPATARSTPSTTPASPTAAPERVTITFVSDRRLNGPAAWSDAHGSLHTQLEVPLAQHDPSSELWSASLVFTRRSPDGPLHATFRSAGRFAHCEVRVDSTVVAEDTARGDRPTSTCLVGRETPDAEI